MTPCLKFKEASRPITRMKTSASVRFQHDFIANNDEDGGDLPEGAETGIDVQKNHHLSEMDTNLIPKKDVMAMVKAFLKRMKLHLDKTNIERTKGFMTGATEFFKFFASKFDEFQVFTGQSLDFEASFVFAIMLEQDHPGPTFYFFNDALKAEKV